MGEFDRIVRTPDILGGKARIRDRRITGATLFGQIGAGYTIDQILSDYPSIEREDVLQALRYAAELAQGAEAAHVAA